MRERLIKLIQEAVGGCTTHWAGLIADHLIENGLIAPQWISVKDELPPNKDLYLCAGVTVVDGRLREEAIVRILRPYYTWISSWKDAENFVVTHWMPLPKPPKEEA